MYKSDETDEYFFVMTYFFNYSQLVSSDFRISDLYIAFSLRSH